MHTQMLEGAEAPESTEPGRMPRTELRELAVRVDAANGGARDPAEAALVWRGLRDGRFDVVDEFDCGGRRYVVVRRRRGLEPKLTSRERQVLEHAAAGRAGKSIAFELGISQSTVALHLKSAAKKLGYRSRVALVLAVAVAERADHRLASPPK